MCSGGSASLRQTVLIGLMGSDGTRSQTLSDHMDVVARTWSWTIRGQSSSAGGREQVDSPGNQRKGGVATLALQNDNFSTYQRDGIKTRTFYTNRTILDLHILSDKHI